MMTKKAHREELERMWHEQLNKAQSLTITKLRGGQFGIQAYDSHGFLIAGSERKFGGLARILLWFKGGHGE